ncbi:uncharacterized protein BKA78DRAFT_382862 [Phyllosticta capitalensis]|uniref:uncharacterized protein n=1 Tax=Phyllosticta capitalensis TaxID=121624 RepID=UPI00312FCA34
MALQKLTQAMPFVISRNLDTTNDDRTTTIGANVPKLHLSRQTVGFGQEDAYNAYTAGFNRLLDDLWIEAEGRKYMQLQTLTNMATMTLSSFAAELPDDQKLIQSLIAERAELSAVLHAVQDKAMSNDEALERIRSPKLSWLAVFIGRFVSPSLDSVFMLKHGVMKEPAELCTRLQMTKGDEDSVHRVLDVVSSAMVKMEDGKQTLTALELDLKETAIQGHYARLEPCTRLLLAATTFGELDFVQHPVKLVDERMKRGPGKKFG